MHVNELSQLLRIKVESDCLQENELFQILRIKVESERHGVDIVEFEGPAYNHDLKSRKSKLFNDTKNPSPVIGRIANGHGDGAC